MTKLEFSKKLEAMGHHLPPYWIREELLDWLWELIDSKHKEE